MAAVKIEISDVDGELVTFRVQYGMKKTASIMVVAHSLFPAQTTSEAARQQVIELSDALADWLEEGGEISDSPRPD